jgi:methylated-DNA-protein-cysteine methyltransferase-like protein
MTYGQIAEHVGGLSARAVGWAMHGCPRDVPWQRVVNASGGCSTDLLPGAPRGLQRAILEREGVVFRANGTLPLDRYRWRPRAAAVRGSTRRARKRPARTRRGGTRRGR